MTDSLSQHCPNCEEQAGVIVGLKNQLHMVLDREADTQCRHDAKVDALEAEIEKLREALQGVTPSAHFGESEQNKAWWAKARASLGETK